MWNVKRVLTLPGQRNIAQIPKLCGTIYGKWSLPQRDSTLGCSMRIGRDVTSIVAALYPIDVPSGVCALWTPQVWFQISYITLFITLGCSKEDCGKSKDTSIIRGERPIAIGERRADRSHSTREDRLETTQEISSDEYGSIVILIMHAKLQTLHVLHVNSFFYS